MALLLFRLGIVFTVGLPLGPASVWAGGGGGPVGGAGRAAVRGLPLALACAAPDPRAAASARRRPNALHIADSPPPPQPQQPQQPQQPPPPPQPPRPPPPPAPRPPPPPRPPPARRSRLGLIDYYDSFNDSDYAKATGDIELYSDKNGYDDDLDIIPDFEPPPPPPPVKKKPDKPNRKPDKKQLDGKKNKKHQEQEVKNETVTYSWYHNGTEIKNDSRRFVLEDGSLNFRKFGGKKGRAGLQDSGQYRCVANSSLGALLSTVTTLSYAFMDRDFTSFPVSTAAIEGDAVYLPCSLNSNPAVNFTWERGNKPIPLNKRYYIFSTGSLLITNAQKEDDGDYRCTVTNNLLNKMRHSPMAKVAISKSDEKSYPLEFVPRDQSNRTDDSVNINIKIMDVMYGDHVLMGCGVKGRPKPKVTWNFKSEMAEEEDKEISSMEVYRIKSATEDNVGLYTCIATNANQSIHQMYHLNVFRVPYLKQFPASDYTPTARTVRFNCSAEGSPTPLITWYKDGRLLPITGRVKIKANDKRPPELIISDTVSSDKGVYQCIASNSIGEVEAWGALSVRPPLGVLPPAIAKCVPITASTVQITLEAPPLVDVLAYTVHYVLTDGGEEHSQIIGAKTYSPITLEPFRKYDVYAKSYINTRGASDQSEHILCQGQGASVKLFNLSDSAIKISWGEQESRYVQEWRLQYRRGSNGLITNITLPASVKNYNITDIFPASSYEFRILGSPSQVWLEQDLSQLSWTSANGSSPLPSGSKSRVMDFRALDLNAQPTDAHAINVTWRIDDRVLELPGHLSVVCFSQYDDSGDNENVLKYRETCTERYATNASSTNWLQIKGLEPYTWYAFKVQIVTKDLQQGGPFSDTVICRTQAEFSITATDVQWTISDDNIVRISWIPMRKPGHNDKGIFPHGSDSVTDSTLKDRDHSAYDVKPRAYTVFYNENYQAPMGEWKTVNVTNGTTVELRDLNTDVKNYMVISPLGEMKGTMHTILPHQDHSKGNFTADQNSKQGDANSSTDQNFGILVGVGLSAVCVVVCVACIAWQHHKMRRHPQALQGTQLRTNRVARSDFESQELVSQPTHIDSKGGVVYINGVGSEGSLELGVGEPLLNGHIHITENPRYTSKKRLPNGNCKPLLGKKSFAPVFDGTLDVSRYEELPDVTAETVLESDLTMNISVTADQVRSDATDRPSSATLSPGYMPDSSLNKGNSLYNNVPNSNTIEMDGSSVHVDRNSNSEVSNMKRAKESLNNDIIENDKAMLDTKSGAKREQDRNMDKCKISGSGLGGLSVDPVTTLDYREKSGSRRLAPALGPNG